ncbi:hypothetical protein [Cohaesibacter gelatinilyticus]|uniref:hypothetical protein n=1 Tax=Cohaesibacter gelatinilyticus TaxID=372072 RepID=UPI001141528B|nr:hypothetical protein [Cohaesibacter gelatinilyticus]
MRQEDFLASLRSIIEHSSRLAGTIFPVLKRAIAIGDMVREADKTDRLKVYQSHPYLTPKPARPGGFVVSSPHEQAKHKIRHGMKAGPGTTQTFPENRIPFPLAAFMTAPFTTLSGLIYASPAPAIGMRNLRPDRERAHLAEDRSRQPMKVDIPNIDMQSDAVGREEWQIRRLEPRSNSAIQTILRLCTRPYH